MIKNRPCFASVIGPGCCLIAFVFFCGCAGFSSSSSQIAKVQQEKEQLLQAIRAQKAEVAELRSTNEKLASRLDEAEKEIARGPSIRKFSGWDSGKPLEVARNLPTNTPTTTPAADAAAAKPAESAVASQVEQTKLPWKPSRPSGTGEGKWKQLTQQYSWLKFDEAAATLTVDAPVEFESDGSTLSRASKETLDQLAKVLKDGPGKELRIVVASQAPGNATNPRQVATTRAAAVADYLDRRGIASERLAVTAAVPGGSGSNASRSLSIHLLDRDAPVVGLAPQGTQRR